MTFQEAYTRCVATDSKLFEPKDIVTNDEVLKLAQDKGMNQFWIGIHNYQYASDGTPILWSNKLKGSQDTDCDDNGCFVFGKEGGGLPTFDFNFGKWSGKCCTLKKYGAVCDKKKSKFLRSFFLHYLIHKNA